jgi:pSer/pThr/pTyr-binding forkhead associated (FHA) protein
MYELRLLRDGASVFVVRVCNVALQIGRDPTNDLVLADPMVSAQHALLWVQDGALRVRDLGSRNGTFVDEVRVEGSVVVPDGAEVRFGPDARARAVKISDTDITAEGLVVEDVATGVCTALASDRLNIGSGPDADLVLPTAPLRLATLIVHDGGEVWVGTEDDEHPVEVGEPFSVGGREFVIRPGDTLRAPTQGPRGERYPYALTATLTGPTGPAATIRNVQTGQTYRIDAENRAVLLYLLTRRVVQDREAGLPQRDLGWLTDDDVRTGVWGRGASEDNKLHVLIYRLRNELQKAGFDPWFIEKKRRFVRVRLAGAEVV